MMLKSINYHRGEPAYSPLAMVTPGELPSKESGVSTRDHFWDDNIPTCVVNGGFLRYLEQFFGFPLLPYCGYLRFKLWFSRSLIPVLADFMLLVFLRSCRFLRSKRVS